MLRPTIALHWATSVLFLLLLQEEMHQGINGTAMPYNSEAIRISPLTDYFNIRGKKIKSVEDGQATKKFILIRGKRRKKIAEAIQKNRVIDVPSGQVIDSMKKAYVNTEHTCKEEGFFVGKKGEISIIVEGKDRELSDTTRRPALNELIAKGDEPVYDVHTHIVCGQDTLTIKGKYGTACASDTADGDTNPAGFIGATQAKVILGYEPTIAYYQGRCPIGEENINVPNIKLYQTIGFYDTTGTFLKLNFEKFIKVAKQINSKN